jgi:orotidine-5'-phosphate decarboxylase
VDELDTGVDVEQLVITRARRSLESGCDGVICSGQEAVLIRKQLDHRLYVVTPGIRPSGDRPPDDQKRVVTVEQAFRNGADHIVVGRPIRDAADPRAAAESIQSAIARLF